MLLTFVSPSLSHVNSLFMLYIMPDRKLFQRGSEADKHRSSGYSWWIYQVDPWSGVVPHSAVSPQ